MSDIERDSEALPASSETFSRLDAVLLAASLAISETAGFTPEDSKARYILLGIATLAFVKGMTGMIRADHSTYPDLPDQEVLRHYNSFGEL